MNRKNLRRSGSIAALLLAAAAVGCGDDSSNDGAGGAGGTGGTGGNGGNAPTNPAFAIATSVFGDAGSATYVSVLTTLELQSLDLSKASEHAGFATIGAVDGRLFVGDGEKAQISRYDVGASGALAAKGKIGFDFYGLQVAPLYHNAFAGSDRAWVNFEETRRAVWDPTAFELVEMLENPGIDAERDGLQVRAAFDRGIAVRDGYVFQPYYWTDANYYRFAPDSQIAIYDAADGSLVDLLDAPCPGLDAVTRDEAGNLYFSNWVFSAAGPVLDDTLPATCAVRIEAGALEIDETWTRDLGELVEGRQTAAFRYLADGIGVLAALDADRIGTEPGTISNDANWRLWTVNLETGTGTPVEGLGHIAGGYYAFRFEGRTLLLLPTADYASTTVYELSPDGKAEPLFQTAGWAYQFVQVR